MLFYESLDGTQIHHGDVSTYSMGSLFDGIAGFPLAAERAGMRVLWTVEIDPACRRVSTKHFPGATQFADVREVGRHNLAPVDLITFGSPCQDLSVAGKRAGLNGERSGLFYEAIRIIRDLRPAFALWENVPGALSSHGGRDFGAAIDALADAGALDIAWTVLDAQWFGLAQRRRRVFTLADFRAERAAEVLSVPSGGPGDPPPSRETRQGAAASLTSGSHGAGVNGSGRPKEDDVNRAAVGALTSRYAKGPDSECCDGMAIAACLTANYGKQLDNSDRNGGPPNLVTAFDWQAGGSASDQSFRGKSRKYIVREGEHSGALSGTRVDAIAYQCQGTNVGEMGTLRSGNGHLTGGVPFTFEPRVARNGRGAPSEVAAPLKAQNGRTGKDDGAPYVAHALSAEGADASEDGTGRGTPLVPLFAAGCEGSKGAGIGREGDPMFTLDTTGAMGVGNGMAVRRLTPLECTRLQGYPDSWLDGLGLADSTKYRMLGNSVAIPVVEWIIRRLVRALPSKGDGE